MRCSAVFVFVSVLVLFEYVDAGSKGRSGGSSRGRSGGRSQSSSRDSGRFQQQERERDKHGSRYSDNNQPKPQAAPVDTHGGTNGHGMKDPKEPPKAGWNVPPSNSQGLPPHNSGSVGSPNHGPPYPNPGGQGSHSAPMPSNQGSYGSPPAYPGSQYPQAAHPSAPLAGGQGFHGSMPMPGNPPPYNPAGGHSVYNGHPVGNQGSNIPMAGYPGQHGYAHPGNQGPYNVPPPGGQPFNYPSAGYGNQGSFGFPNAGGMSSYPGHHQPVGQGGNPIRNGLMAAAGGMAVGGLVGAIAGNSMAGRGRERYNDPDPNHAAVISTPNPDALPGNVTPNPSGQVLYGVTGADGSYIPVAGNPGFPMAGSPGQYGYPHPANQGPYGYPYPGYPGPYNVPPGGQPAMDPAQFPSAGNGGVIPLVNSQGLPNVASTTTTSPLITDTPSSGTTAVPVSTESTTKFDGESTTSTTTTTSSIL